MLKKPGTWIFAAFALLLAACGEGAGAGNGQLTVRLTDAAFPFDSVARADIFVVRIDAKLAETDDADAATEIEDEGSEHGNANGLSNDDPSHGWVTIATPNESYNLLDLQNGTTVNLGQATLPTGDYRGFRLILDTDKSSVTLKDGTVLNGNSRPGIKWPSAGRTGVKIELEDAISVVEGETVMVLDFDLGRSFVMRGHSLSQSGLLFKPVIRAVARQLTGSVSGTVHQGSETGAVVADATVEVVKTGTTLNDTDPANVIQSGETDANGAFHLSFIIPGTYALRATPPSTLTDYNGVLLASIVIAAGSDAGGQVLVLPHK
jgi:hypothetical protein